jgi:cell division protein FtsL
MAARAWPVERQRRIATGPTPEIYFTKRIDNSRLVKFADPKRNREMLIFAIALCCLFLLVMVYAWQHFSAIEYGYRIEAARAQRDALVEANRTLQLEEASLRDPARIDMLARQLGLQSPSAGQLVRLDPAMPETGAPVLARAGSVVAAAQ